MLSPRGYGLAYGFEIASHRLLRYASPFLHLIALAANLALLGEGPVYVVTLAAQLALLAAAALAGAIPLRPLRLARYYVLDHRLDRRRALGPDPRSGRPGPGRRRRGRGDGEQGGREQERSAALGGSAIAGRAGRRLAGAGVAALAIKLDSRGPVLYRARRVGPRRRASSTCSSCGRCTPATTRSGSAPRCWPATRG